jgi:hypothetical protein
MDFVIFGHGWIDLGLNKGRYWFLIFLDVPPT